MLNIFLNSRSFVYENNIQILLSSFTEDNGTAYPSITAFESSSLRVTFNFSKQPGNPQITLIDALFENKTSNSCTNFIFQAAVPKVVSCVM